MKLQEFINANPWLEKCKNDFHDWWETTPSFWWDGYEYYSSTKNYVNLDLRENLCVIRVISGGQVKVEKHFLNWKAPTKQENEMFAMLYGHPLPWSEEQPFIWEE